MKSEGDDLTKNVIINQFIQSGYPINNDKKSNDISGNVNTDNKNEANSSGIDIDKTKKPPNNNFEINSSITTSASDLINSSINQSNIQINSGSQQQNIIYPSLNQNQNIIINNQNQSFNGSLSNNNIEASRTIDTQNINNFIFPQHTQQTNFELTKKAILASLKDQQTTIILQKILMEAKNETIVSIVNELKGEYRNLILDKNGNYLCTDLFKICNQKERIEILKELSPTLSEDCVNNYATHPIQTLIEFSSCELEYKLILYSFNDYNKLLYATIDPNGAYVIQKIIIRIPERFRPEFNYIFISFISFVSKQKYGIVAVKKFISCTKHEDIVNQVIDFIRNNFMSLSVDKFGNYLIQFLLEKWNNFPEGKVIKDLIFQNFKVMIGTKYSAFICELYVKMLSSEEKRVLVNSLDLNEIKKMNIQFGVKTLKMLGINNISDNNFNNNFANQMQLPFNLGGYFNNNNFNFPQNYNNQIYQNNNIHGNTNNNASGGYRNRQNHNNKNKHKNNK